MMKKHIGFTRIEFLIVVGILALLAVIFIPNFRKTRTETSSVPLPSKYDKKMLGPDTGMGTTGTLDQSSAVDSMQRAYDTTNGTSSVDDIYSFDVKRMYDPTNGTRSSDSIVPRFDVNRMYDPTNGTSSDGHEINKIL